MSKKKLIGVIGSGTMGAGIAQVSAAAGHKTFIFDSNKKQLQSAKYGHEKILQKLVEKGKINEAKKNDIVSNFCYEDTLETFKDCGLIIEAIVENLEVKQNLFCQLEKIIDSSCILATNTSSLSVASIAGSCKNPERVVGLHFFNPAPLMPLVEVVPTIQTNNNILQNAKSIVDSWGKTSVIAKDTPGFIVNRIARPFYGEAIRIYEEGFADIPTIDWAMKNNGGFKMGPFELMDFIGNDVNYKVTETIFNEFFYDPRYKPSFTQKRMVEAKRLGKKTGLGYYDYKEGAKNPEPNKNEDICHDVFMRILVMLINEAAEAVFMNIASKKDIDLAMTLGVNYPKGLLKWADKIGLENVLEALDFLHHEYGDARYRASALLRQMVRKKMEFYE